MEPPPSENALDTKVLEGQVSLLFELVSRLYLDPSQIEGVLKLDISFTDARNPIKLVAFLERLFELELIDPRAYLFLMDTLITLLTSKIHKI